MNIIKTKIWVTNCIAGIYLRWWYNGWHYWNFSNGYEIELITESMGIQVTNYFSVISKIERDTRIKSEYAYKVTVQGIHPLDIAGFAGLLMAEMVEQYEGGLWREVLITRGDHLIKHEGDDSYVFDFEITRKERPNSSSVYQKTLKLYLGDTLCDMDDEEIVPINKQVNNIAEMQDRQSDFTAQFKVRKTRRMRALFELSGEVGASTIFPYQRQECRLIQDNIEVITGGILVLDRVDDEYYYVSVLSGNLNFFNLIQSLKLSDLTLPHCVHNWNADFMESTHSVTSPGVDVVYEDGRKENLRLDIGIFEREVIKNNSTTFEDDYQAWKFLQSRGYEQSKGVIKYRKDKKGCMPEDESAAIDYLFSEWDWAYA